MKMRVVWVLAAAMGSAAWGQTADLASNVDMFIGTGPSPVNDNGLTMPAAALPFGMVAWGPDPSDDKFYRYAKTNTRGFSLTHISGVGCEAFGDFPILPVDGEIGVSPAVNPMPYVAKYRRENETTGPGFYGVRLDSGVTVQLAGGVAGGDGCVWVSGGWESA